MQMDCVVVNTLTLLRGPLPGEVEQIQVEVTIRASSSFSNSSEEMTTLRNIFVERM
jgi:hypothetical protein